MNSTSSTSTNGTHRLLFRPHEAAEMLGISERTLWQLTKDGKIPVVRDGRIVRYTVADLEGWIARARTQGTNGQAQAGVGAGRE